jgi:MoaA/NifB/PqqE/SkfB family radical SAM enzyme
MLSHLPSTVCFRVTRHCNARCGFCLAPPDGINPPVALLIHRLDWLLFRGVKTIHFCGGEPTIYPDLPQLLTHVYAQGGKIKLTTNAIVVSDTLAPVLYTTGAKVKVSLHGDREHHNKMVGRVAFDHTLRRLVAAGIFTAVQTTVVTGGKWVVDWVAEFCLEVGVRQLNILPFIPRGNGYSRRGEYDMSSLERRTLRDYVARKRRVLNGQLDLRWLDFTARPVPVVEPDGRVVLEGATEAMDKVICYIPEGDSKAEYCLALSQ